MRQIFGVAFWQLSQNDKDEIEQYVLNCIRREFIDKPYPTSTNEIERRRYQRVKPQPEDNVRLGLQFSPDETDIIIEEVFDISVGGAKCFYTGNHTIKEGDELEHVAIFLPNRAIECQGRVVHISRG